VCVLFVNECMNNFHFYFQLYFRKTPKVRLKKEKLDLSWFIIFLTHIFDYFVLGIFGQKSLFSKWLFLFVFHCVVEKNNKTSHFSVRESNPRLGGFFRLCLPLNHRASSITPGSQSVTASVRQHFMKII
jgi:hypothetical protein